MKRWMLVLGVALALSAWATVDLAAQKKKPAPQPPNEIHEPERAVANLDVHPELQATLFVSEPKITNPTNLDIDHRGRIWLCDVVNYRGNNGKRKEGDRILILEDTDGDGVCDKVTTFYQGRDVDSAMGICVLGNKVIVSCSPNVFVFHFDENDKITKREVLFTKTGVPQHDHSAHSFVFGPDGRLYWNFGNTGQAVHDKDGKPVVDLMGNKVVDNGKPYWGGMVFRCELDGSNFETLGHNFRNNYEVAVDSFGTLWQSDNDDDGNRGVRINYVMEYGNYGYRDEFTGAGWQAKRTNMEKDIPLRHWHLNDPGVVQNLLKTYQGSPTGICVYEGSLLPKVFRNQAIHCDAGPSIVRAYPVTPEGAGYKASIVNILDGAKKNNWFRPADVCVAPDGSLFVTDWYDPGVGGHQQKDLDRGRVFRVAPNASPRPSGGEGPGVKGQKYVVPKAKFETIEDNIEALKSPNNATRHLAWTNLHKAGAKAEAALLKMYESKVPHERARALWLLGRIPGKGQHYVNLASADKDADIRIVGIRLARQLKLDVAALIGGAARLTYDASPAVRRECAIALHESKSREKAFAWAELASRIDGADRWYLEALGIGAQGDWDRCLEAWFSAPRGGRRLPYSQGERDIIWRSRAGMTPRLLADMIAHEKMPSDELPRLLRAFDFQADSDTKNEALVKLAFGDYSDPERRKLITTEAINRLTKFDVKNNPKHAAALDKVLDGAKGTAGYVEMVGKFNVSNRFPELLAIAQKTPTEQIGVDAIRVLLDRDQVKLIETGLAAKDPVLASNTAQAIAGAQHDKANALLLPIVLDAKQDLELRRQATRALARTKSGAERLIALAREKKLGSELNIAAGGAMASAPWADIRKQAADLFPQPTTKDKKPLPAIPDLVKMKGNAGNGQAIFAKAGTCAKCHIVNGEGKNVGPDLSEIGKKLAREAMFESILYPSASILHNYETWVVVTNKGTTANGLLVSKTAEEVSLKDSEGIVRTFKMGDVDSLSRSSVSLMPADLHRRSRRKSWLMWWNIC